MIDSKTIKEIRISEGSVKKITNSSGVVLWQKVVTPSASLDIDLNNQWVDSTKTLDGYKVYMSNSNHNVNNGYASMKFKFKGMPNFKLWINSYAESSFDYTIAWNMDVNYPTSNPSYSSTGVKAHTSGKQYNPANGLTAFTEVDYANDGGEHFVVVTFRKDSSVNYDDDRGYVAVKLTLLSTTWVVSSTEFVKQDDKYYQRINEVETYEGGVTAPTGNFKKGNELTVIYKQGSVDDYIVNDGKKYYKNYIYVTPKDQEINTGDYIQGDYIGEATPSMKVTYVDGTEKNFYNLTTIEQDTDPNKVNAKEVVIGDGVTSIGDWAFGIDEYDTSRYQSCRSLTSVTIPDSVTSIGAGAFNQCLSLSSITIPNSVTSIGEYSFSEIKITSITIPNSLRTISRGAFENCSKLESVTIQNSSSKISYDIYAFNNIPSNVKLFVPSNLLSQYQQDYSWKNVFKGGIYAIGTIPSMKVKYVDGTEKKFYGLSSIEENTDANKKNAKEIVIGDPIIKIGNQAFWACTNLTDVTLSNSLVIIDNGAFFGCSNLTGIRLPESVTNIGEYAFCLCSSITSITIPTNVTEIGKNTFNQCSKLTEITFKATTPPTLDSTAFSDSGIQTIYVPAASLDAYKSATNWSAFASKIKAIPS